MSPFNQEMLELLLMDYAAGVLNEAHTLFVSSYLTFSEEAKSFVEEYESMGGCLMESCSPIKMKEESLFNVLGIIESQTEPPAEKEKEIQIKKEQEVWPEPLLLHIKTPYKWRYVLPGVKAVDVPIQSCHSKALLIKASPGVTIPTHEHRGRELTLVLDGSLTDETGTYRQGDILIRDKGTIHTPVADDDEGFLSLNIIDLPVKHRGFYAFFDVVIRY
jgi:putative transcriptional regulator